MVTSKSVDYINWFCHSGRHRCDRFSVDGLEYIDKPRDNIWFDIQEFEGNFEMRSWTFETGDKHYIWELDHWPGFISKASWMTPHRNFSMLHRLDGPAVELVDAEDEYWIGGIKYEKSDYFKKICDLGIISLKEAFVEAI
jgi:hypothetical protein